MVRDTGMLFLANEAPKILTYYIPVSWLVIVTFAREKWKSQILPYVYAQLFVLPLLLISFGN